MKKRVEIEKKHLLSKIHLKDELKQSLYRVAPGKDIVFELIDQFVVHEELDKIRRDLNAYTYRAKDPSYLFKEENSIVFKEQIDSKGATYKSEIAFIPDSHRDTSKPV